MKKSRLQQSSRRDRSRHTNPTRQRGRPAESPSLARRAGVSELAFDRVTHRDSGRKLVVLYEDNHCLAVFKPAGMLTMGDRTGDVTLVDLARQYLKEKYRKPGNVFLGVVHRLDRPVSGVVLFARTSKAAARLSKQFREGTVQKIYRAWVAGVPRELSGEFIDYVAKDARTNMVRRVEAGETGAQRASLKYRTLDRRGGQTLVEIRPATGRPHQIRVQLAAHGLPIIGDAKYGDRAHPAESIRLHAAKLRFRHPVQARDVSVTANHPLDWPA